MSAASRVDLSGAPRRASRPTRPGVCGQVEGLAMVYEVPDGMRTVFAAGCLDAFKQSGALSAGRVQLFLDHGDVMGSDYYRTRLHIGTVRSLTPARTPDGQAAERLVADLFDTAAGRQALEYLTAVVQSRTVSGLSPGFTPDREAPGARSTGVLTRFLAVTPYEFSITARQAIPGCFVTAVRAGAPALATMDERAHAARRSMRSSPARPATMAERLAAVRASHRR